MIRAVEWILAAVGAAVTIGVALAFSPATFDDRAASAILAAVALLGFGGFLAVALDSKGRSPRWGAITWIVAGALSAMVILAGFSYGLFLLPAALAFLGAGLLASRRKERSLPGYLGLYLGGGLACALVIALVNLLGWV